jgi:PHD/YefM family antitoxin component YafN of YafNO toxin-antitoxin module
MLLLLVNNGHPRAARVDPADFDAVAAEAHVVVDLDHDPVIVLRDRRRRTPYLPDHRTLETWLRQLAEDAVRR